MWLDRQALIGFGLLDRRGLAAFPLFLCPSPPPGSLRRPARGLGRRQGPPPSLPRDISRAGRAAHASRRRNWLFESQTTGPEPNLPLPGCVVLIGLGPRLLARPLGAFLTSEFIRHARGGGRMCRCCEPIFGDAPNSIASPPSTVFWRGVPYQANFFFRPHPFPRTSSSVLAPATSIPSFPSPSRRRAYAHAETPANSIPPYRPALRVGRDSKLSLFSPDPCSARMPCRQVPCLAPFPITLALGGEGGASRRGS